MDKSSKSIVANYNITDSGTRDSSDFAFALFLSLFFAIFILSSFFLYYVNTYEDKSVESVILGQEVIKHVGAYGTFYEHKNTVLIGKNCTTVDSIEMMARFHPGDKVNIVTTYNKHTGKILKTRYEKGVI